MVMYLFSSPSFQVIFYQSNQFTIRGEVVLPGLTPDHDEPSAILPDIGSRSESKAECVVTNNYEKEEMKEEVMWCFSRDVTEFPPF